MADEEYTAKLFTNGGSQAVRLPKQLRLPGTEVRVRRLGNGVLLEPVEAPGWPPGFWEQMASLPPLPDDFDVPEPLPPEPHRDAVIDAWVAEGRARPRPHRGDRERAGVRASTGAGGGGLGGGVGGATTASEPPWGTQSRR